MVAFLIKV